MEALAVGESQRRIDDAGEIADGDGGFPDPDGGLVAIDRSNRS
jgi:hypothetical protein